MNAVERLLTVSLALAAIFFLPLEWREKTLAFGVLIASSVLILFSQMLALAGGKLAAKTRPPISWGFLFLSRNRRQTTACALSFGIGLAALTAIVNVQGNFKDRIDDTLRREAPGFYLVGVPPTTNDKLRQRLNEVDKTTRLQTTPFLRGRITHLRENRRRKLMPRKIWLGYCVATAALLGRKTAAISVTAELLKDSCGRYHAHSTSFI